MSYAADNWVTLILNGNVNLTCLPTIILFSKALARLPILGVNGSRSLA